MSSNGKRHFFYISPFHLFFIYFSRPAALSSSVVSVFCLLRVHSLFESSQQYRTKKGKRTDRVVYDQVIKVGNHRCASTPPPSYLLSPRWRTRSIPRLYQAFREGRREGEVEEEELGAGGQRQNEGEEGGGRVLSVFFLAFRHEAHPCCFSSNEGRQTPNSKEGRI